MELTLVGKANVKINGRNEEIKYYLSETRSGYGICIEEIDEDNYEYINNITNKKDVAIKVVKEMHKKRVRMRDMQTILNTMNVY